MHLRQALRRLTNDPVPAVTAVITLVVGIVACVTVFSVADVTLLRALPYPKPERLVVVNDRLTKLNIPDMAVAWPHYEEYRNQPVFEETAGFMPSEFTVTMQSHSERMNGVRISPELLPMLGVQPALGRNVRPEESRVGHDQVVLLSHSIWTDRFGGATDVIGRPLTLDGRPHTIIGVLPAGFAFRPFSGPRPDLYAPVPFDSDPRPKPPRVRILARLKPGVTPEQAQQHMHGVAERLSPHQVLYGGPRAKALGYDIAVAPLRERLFGTLRRPVYLFCGAVGFVLLIACLNVANLLLVRAQARSRDFAVRQALGAGRFSIVADVLAESLLISVVAAAVGTVLAYSATQLLVYLGPQELADARVDWRSAAFAAALSVVVACLSGAIPAIRITRGNVADFLAGARTSTTGRARRRTLKTLVSVEVALSLVLLTGSALLLRSLSNLNSTDIGFNRDGVVTGIVTLPEARYKEPAELRGFYSRLLQALRTSPGVRSATLTSGLPLMMPPSGAPFVIEGQPFTEKAVSTQTAHSLAVDPDYFATLGIPLVAGRAIEHRDAADTTRVAVINETLASKFFAGDNPIGKRILVGGPRPNAPWLTIMGIVKDVRMTGPSHHPLPQIYTSVNQWPSLFGFIVIRSQGDPSTMPALLRKEVSRLDPGVAAHDIRTMGERFAISTSRPRFQTALLSTFAAFALILALVGICGVVAYSVAQRTKEIGVRLAIGASSRDVLTLMVRDGMKPVLIGAAAGLILSAYLSDLLATMLYETKPVDPIAYAIAASAFIAVALISCALAARRAVAVDPVTALRID